jgi:uncharacterized protein YcfL
MKLFLLIPVTAAVLTLAGCGTPAGPYPAQDTKYSLENTESFVLMDKPTQVSITCTGFQQRVTSDGRLEVVANIKNRENRRLQVQISCAFKNEGGFSTGDETPWETLILGENATEAVRFTSMNAQAKKYTVRVRQSR